MALTLANHITELERILILFLRLAFKHRFAPVADLAALQAASIATTTEGALRYVTAEDRVYWYSAFSGAAQSLPAVVQPTGSTAPGRWLRVDVPWTYGPNGNRPLRAQQTGVCKAVELFNGASTETMEALLKVFEQRPALFLQWTESPVQAQSIYAGAHYKIPATFNLVVASENLRGDPWGMLGEPGATEQNGKDPGLSWLLGQVLKVCAGVDLATPGIESVEIGKAQVLYQGLQERVFVGVVPITVRVWVLNEDEDLVAARVDAHPNLGDTGDAPKFDVLNFVAQGYTITPGPGLTRSYGAGLATVGGVSVASTPPDVTFTADRDTYRDLLPDGTLTYVAVARDAPPPAVTATALRLACTSTDSTGVVADHWIACSSVQWFETVTVP